MQEFVLDCVNINAFLHINNKIYDSNSLDKLKLIGYALSEKLEVTSNGNAAYIVLSRKDLLDHNFK